MLPHKRGAIGSAAPGHSHSLPQQRPNFGYQFGQIRLKHTPHRRIIHIGVSVYQNIAKPDYAHAPDAR